MKNRSPILVVLALALLALFVVPGLATEYFLRYDYNNDGTSEFYVDTSGNHYNAGTSAIGSTLTVTGLTSLNGGLAMDSTVFTIADTTGAISWVPTTTTGNAGTFNFSTLISGIGLKLIGVDATLSGGKYVNIYGGTGTTSVWSVGEGGATLITPNVATISPLYIDGTVTTTAHLLTMCASDVTLNGGKYIRLLGGLATTEVWSVGESGATIITPNVGTVIAQYIDGTASTSGDLLKMKAVDATLDGGLYINCLGGDGTAAKFTVGEGGNVVVAGTLGVTGAVTASSTIAATGAITSAASQTDGYVFIGPEDVGMVTGTWTLTRGAQGNYYSRKTATDETSYIRANLSQMLQRLTASKGVRISGIDYIYGIATKDLDAHSATLDKVTYASGSAVSVASFGGTLAYSPGDLVTALAAQPLLTTITPGTPAFNNTDDTAVILEITVNASDTSVYDFYGLGVHYTYANL